MLDRFIKFVSNRGVFDSVWLTLDLFFGFVRGVARGFPGVYIGKSVKIRGKNNIRIGRLTRVEDFCELDGFGEQGIVIGRRCKIGKFSIVRVPGVPFEKGAGVEIGDGTTFGEYCFIGGAGRVRFGNGNSIGQYCSFHPQNHLPFEDSFGCDETKTSELGIEFGDRNWVGAKATILDGASLGDESIVGACTLFRGRFGSRKLVVGVPAEVKKDL